MDMVGSLACYEVGELTSVAGTDHAAEIGDIADLHRRGPAVR